MKIGTQVVLVTFLIAIITILGISLTSVRYFSQYARQMLRYAMKGLKDYTETDILKIRYILQ